VTDGGGGQHDERERRVQRKDGDEGRRGDAPQPGVLQCPRADAVRRMHDQRGDRRLQPIEQAGHERQLAVGQVDPRQRDEDEQRRQHEQPAGHEAPAAAVHQPADVGGELLRFGPGQQHAVVQRVQEALLADPAPPLDQLGVHDGDLPGRPAEADEAELEPEAQRFPEADGKRRGVG
jgi:hypothetical protein